jgi:glycosyltransferase involved in cell wall biosynthesis
MQNTTLLKSKPMGVLLTRPKIHLLTVLIYGRTFGGAERRLLELSKWFRKLGVQVHSLQIERPSTGSVLKHLLTLMRISFIGIRLCKRFGCNLVYASRHDIENLIPAFLISRLTGRPLVILFHHLSSKDKLPLGKLLALRLKQGFSLASAAIYTLLDFLSRFICRSAEAQIAVSHVTAKEGISYFGIKHFTVAGDGIDMSRYEASGSCEKLYDAAFLGRIRREKGIDTLLKAWAIVTSKRPSAQLVIIGGGEKKMLEFYESMTKKFGLENNITFTGFVDDMHVVKILKSSKIFVFPSELEGFGLAVAEAMACGLPCVISDIPALKENFGEVAILVKPRDIEGFAEAVLSLLINEEKRKSLEQLVQAYVKKFSWEKVAMKEIKVFEDLLSLKDNVNSLSAQHDIST